MNMQQIWDYDLALARENLRHAQAAHRHTLFELRRRRGQLKEIEQGYAAFLAKRSTTNP